MLRSFAVVLFTLSFTGIAFSQERAAPILDIFERLPMPSGDEVVEIHYGNPGPVRGTAMMAAALGQMDDDPLYVPMMRTVPVLLAPHVLSGLEDLPQSHGIDLLQVERFATMTQLPQRSLILQLPEGGGDVVGPAIRAAGLGYADMQFQGQSVLWRGEDLQADPDQQGDIFGYGLGLSSRLWVDGDLLVQSASWPTMAQAIAGPAGSVGHIPEVRALASVFDAGLETPGEVVALRIYLNLPWFEFGHTIMVADMLHGAREGAVFAVVTETVAQAERMAELARANWDSVPGGISGRTMADLFTGEMRSAVHEIDGMPVLTVTVHGPRNREIPYWQNSAFNQFNQMLVFLDLGWLTE